MNAAIIVEYRVRYLIMSGDAFIEMASLAQASAYLSEQKYKLNRIGRSSTVVDEWYIDPNGRELRLIIDVQNHSGVYVQGAA